MRSASIVTSEASDTSAGMAIASPPASRIDRDLRLQQAGPARGEHHRRAAPPQFPRGGRTDTGAGSGHDRDLAGQREVTVRLAGSSI